VKNGPHLIFSQLGFCFHFSNKSAAPASILSRLTWILGITTVAGRDFSNHGRNMHQRGKIIEILAIYLFSAGDDYALNFDKNHQTRVDMIIILI